MAFFLETSFAIEPPKSAVKVDETIVGQSVSDLTDDDSAFKKSFRGKGLQWEAFIDPKTQDFKYYSEYSDVIRDAAALKHAKFSTREHEHKYRCKAIHCSYKRILISRNRMHQSSGRQVHDHQ